MIKIIFFAIFIDQQTPGSLIASVFSAIEILVFIVMQIIAERQKSKLVNLKIHPIGVVSTVS